jgi:hypothetical protein
MILEIPPSAIARGSPLDSERVHAVSRFAWKCANGAHPTRRGQPEVRVCDLAASVGCCAGGTSKRLREMALVSETCLDRDKRNGFLAKQ